MAIGIILHVDEGGPLRLPNNVIDVHLGVPVVLEVDGRFLKVDGNLEEASVVQFSLTMRNRGLKHHL